MLTETQAQEILRALNALPAGKVEEVRDFVAFLRDRYGREAIVDESDEWTDEDMRDLTAAALRHADQSLGK